MNDNLISREDAIDAMTDDNIIRNMDSVYDSALHRIKRSMIRILAGLPSAEPERKWIPCSERLPDWNEHRNEMVLVCYGNGSIRLDTYMHDDWVHGNPIAWMPLPPKYEGQKNEETYRNKAV